MVDAAGVYAANVATLPLHELPAVSAVRALHCAALRVCAPRFGLRAPEWVT